jgi:RluA family pseudouridine synthase
VKNNHKWRVTRKQAGMRLLQFLRECCSQASSVKAIKRAIDGKLCTVNNRVEIFSSYILKENDTVVLSETAFLKENIPRISILYEDKELFIINKPSGVLSDAKEIQTLTSKKGLELVHRLDKETSGVLILVKTLEAKEKMMALFKERALCKLYLALVDGVVKQDEGTIDNYLGKKHSYQGQAIYGSVGVKTGRRAITHWKCFKRGKNASVVRCELHTGRTHQLRAHLSGMGHPILGDVQYGKKFSCPLRPQRNLLHAYSVAFKHPMTSKQLKLVAPIPLDFKEALEGLGISLGRQ